MLATIKRGYVALISGVQDCAAQPIIDGNAVESIASDNGLYVIPEAYLNDVLSRYGLPFLKFETGILAYSCLIETKTPIDFFWIECHSDCECKNYLRGNSCWHYF